MPTPRVPGRAARRSIRVCCRISSLASPAAAASGMAIRSVCSVPGSLNPGWTRRIDWKVRIIRPEPMRSTSASATWMMVRVLRVMLRSRPALALRPPERSASARRMRPRLSTGIAPKARPATTERTSVKSTEVPSIAIRSKRGSRAGERLSTSSIAPAARPRPAAPPRTANSTLSVSISRARRPRPAPMAAPVHTLAPIWFTVDFRGLVRPRAGCAVRWLAHNLPLPHPFPF